MKAMVLAAGRGQRLSPLTDTTPKPLLEVGGVSLLERILQALERAGFSEIVVNVSWHAEQITRQLQTRVGVPVRISHETEERLDTGGGICKALPLLGGGPFAVVNADVLTDYPLSELGRRLANWPQGQQAHLVLVPNPAHHTAGDFSLRGDLLQNPAVHTYSGLSVLHPHLFAEQQPGTVFPLVSLLRAAADAGRATGELYQGYWNDVGTLERLTQARQDLKDRPGLSASAP